MKALLQKILSLAREIEKVAEDQNFPEAKLADLRVLLTELSLSEKPDMQRLGEIQEHLHPQMTLRHFVNFIIPIERQLGVQVSDGDIVVLKTDKISMPAKTEPLIFVLDNIRSAFNVGSIFRLADSLGVEKIYISGYTPEPSLKTALGSELSVSFEKKFRLEDALVELQDRQSAVFALETSPQAQNLFDVDFAPKSKGQRTALIVGNERFGLDAHFIEKSLKSGWIQGLVSIPMAGKKNSLNVACALGIVAFEWKRQNRSSLSEMFL